MSSGIAGLGEASASPFCMWTLPSRPRSGDTRGQGDLGPDRMQRSSLARSLSRARPWLLPAMLLLLAACRQEPGTDGELPVASSESAGSFRQLDVHLQHNDMSDFATETVPPDYPHTQAHAL